MTEPSQSRAMIDAIEALSRDLALIRAEISRGFIGQDPVVDQVLATLLAGGHGLLMGVPGLGKTRLVETLGVVLGIDARRVQFTPDLMPADILGSEVLETDDQGRRAFRFIEGPIFCQMLMADEINRASPRTQSALLQAMQERAVSIAGETRPLGPPFQVLATQNPLEQEGTYPLPEAQLDRFLMRIDLPYPSRDEERAILLATTGTAPTPPARIWGPEALIAAQDLIRRMPVGTQVVEAILSLVRRFRPSEPDASELIRRHVAWGPGPRAAQALMLSVRAEAVLRGRLAPSLEDVAAMARPVLAHRMALSFAARADGVSLEALIDEAAATLLDQASAA